MKHKYYNFSENRSTEEARIIYEQRINDATYIYKKHKNNFKIRNCPICNSKESKSVDKFHDMYNIDKCENCASFFINPVPDISALSDYYKNCLCNRQLSKIIKKRYDNNDFINDDRLTYIFNIIKNIKERKIIKILEIGCNNGAFLSKLKQFCKVSFPGVRFELSGVDIDKEAVKDSVDKELNLFYGMAENIYKEHKNEYDIIVHFELIEHLINPIEFIKSVYNMLAEGGKTMFTTPNIEGLENQALGYNNTRYLAHSIFPPMHINSFSMKNISYFLVSNNFSIESVTTPGRLDVDILYKCLNDLDNDTYKDVALLDKNNRALVQKLLVNLGASSHMQCIASKCTPLKSTTGDP